MIPQCANPPLSPPSPPLPPLSFSCRQEPGLRGHPRGQQGGRTHRPQEARRLLPAGRQHLPSRGQQRRVSGLSGHALPRCPCALGTRRGKPQPHHGRCSLACGCAPAAPSARRGPHVRFVQVPDENIFDSTDSALFAMVERPRDRRYRCGGGRRPRRGQRGEQSAGGDGDGAVLEPRLCCWDPCSCARVGERRQ